MARTAVRKADPDEVVDLVDAILPTVVETLPKPQLKAFIKHLFTHHLSTLLRDLDQEERADLLQSLLPTITREFPIQDLDLSTILVEAIDL